MDPEALRRSARLSQTGAEHEQSRIADRGLDPDYIHNLEQFSAFTHQQIHDRVQAMNPGDMHRASETWVTLADSMFGALTTLHATVQNALSEGMSGEMADAADTAARRFVTEATDLAEIATSTGHRILAAAYAAEALRKTVPPPILQASPNIREEFRQIALAALDANYTPIYPPAGSGIPAFFNVMTPAAGDADRELQAESGSSPPSSDPSTYAPASAFPATDARNVPSTAQPERPATPEATAAQDIPSPGIPVADSGYSTGRTSNRTIGAGPQKSTPPSNAIETRPATFNPDDAPLSPTGQPAPAAKPATDWPRPNLVNPTPGKIFPDPTRSDPDPGRSYPGPANPETLTQPRSPISAPDPLATATSPGMFTPGTRATADSDPLHRSPPWLIRDRQQELLGTPLPYVAQTIGAEIIAARNDLTPSDNDSL